MVGDEELTSALPFCSSSLDHHLANSPAVRLFFPYLAMARLWPPRLQTPAPSSPGSAATSNLPLILDESSLVARAYTSPQLRWKIKVPAWNAVRPFSSFQVSAPSGMVPSLSHACSRSSPL